MALRLIKTYSNPVTLEMAKLYKDIEWQEYRVKFFINGVHQVNADYHDSDKISSIDTALYFINLN